MRPYTAICFLFLLSLMGCATITPTIRQEFSPEELFSITCQLGKSVQSVRGIVWLKVDSKEFTGQYPANIMATSDSGELKLELTNVLGGTEAIISVKKDRYEMTRVGGNQDKKDEGQGSWAGIPLQWATELFVGRIPCPLLAGNPKMTLGDHGELSVEVPASPQIGVQNYVYTFRQHQGKPWPKSLRWERQGSPAASIQFTFDSPEDETLSPQKWEVQSARGSVKIKWRDRQISRNPVH